MDKTYSPEALEQACYEKWESSHFFKPQGEGECYCIMLPPPNVTGYLHMGHGFQQTLMDILIRSHRMLGYKTLWQPGTDHAGISTQIVVQRQLEAEGIPPSKLSREQFIEKVWQWKEASGGQITAQMRRIGTSVDWTRERFTMDEGLSAAVQKVFVQLYDEGLIYRGERLVNWDPVLETAISDLEVVSEEEAGFLWQIRYPLVEGEGALEVTTTRPETLLGDVAVAVHPDDKRYQAFIGKEVRLPLCDRNIPVIADPFVDKEFGSGCVKITPAHDFTDHEVAKRHGLPTITILTPKATIHDNAPTQYRGLDRFEARKQIIKDLELEKLLIKTIPYKVKIPRGEKSGSIIEPLLTKQWYVKMQTLAKPAIAAVETGEIRFIPETWTKTYFQWMENIEDWCISRQLIWGHRIPAWYDEAGQVYVGYSENDVRFKYNLNDTVSLTQELDVLDTWFSSALWPFSTLGWPQNTSELKQFYPTSVLVTGFDILFFWVARMIMMGLKFTGKIPFKEVLITGLIRDHDGKKMSKSKGNVLDPIDIIDGIDLESLIKKRSTNLLLESVKNTIIKATKQEFPEGIPAFGTDALRLTFCALASFGRNIRFDLGRVEGSRNFCNKLWNAARYVLMHTDDEQIDLEDGAFQYSPADHWILSRLQHTITSCHHYLKIYRFDLLASTLYEFVWHEYCDWYLELSKPVLYDEQALAPLKRGTKRTLVHLLAEILKLLHPICPFITEAIWTRIGKLSSQNCEESIMLCSYPEASPAFIDEALEKEIHWVQEIIQSLRSIRSDMGISPAASLSLQVKNVNAHFRHLFKKYQQTLSSLCKLTDLHFLQKDEAPAISASAVVGDIELFIPMANLINKANELARLDKEISKLDKEMALSASKLSNPHFTNKAPEEIIHKEEEKRKQAETAKAKLAAHRAVIEKL